MGDTIAPKTIAKLTDKKREEEQEVDPVFRAKNSALILVLKTEIMGVKDIRAKVFVMAKENFRKIVCGVVGENIVRETGLRRGVGILGITA